MGWEGVRYRCRRYLFTTISIYDDIQFKRIKKTKKLEKKGKNDKKRVFSKIYLSKPSSRLQGGGG